MKKNFPGWPLKIKKSILFLWATILPLFLSVGCRDNQESKRSFFTFHGVTMGTTFSIKWVGQGRNNEERAILEKEISAVLQQVNDQMSVFIPTSEVSRFNGSTGEWISVSAETVEVFSQALEISRSSAGAFDVTVAPLIELWGFGTRKEGFHLPPTEMITRLKRIVGYQNIEFNRQPPQLRKRIPQLQCDLSAIAKGWGVDRVAALLEARAFKDYMVEIGGEIKVKGRNEKGSLWKIGIAHPDGKSGIYRVLSLTDMAMATSGDYHNYFENNGQRYTHIIDPATGFPVNHSLVSVTVLDHSCMKADGLATAIMVMGPEKGYNWSLEKNIPVLLISKTEHGFEAKSTPAFTRIL